MGHWETAFLPQDGSPYQAWVPEPIAELELPLTFVQLELAAVQEERMRAFVSSGSRVGDWYFATADAAASTTIEGIYPSLSEVAKTQVTGRGGDAAISAVGNLTAIRAAFGVGQQPGALTVDDVRRIHRLLTSALPDYERVPGMMREHQVRVGGFIPPVPQRVPELMDDLIRFLARDDIHPLHRASIGHARFEEIHPFPDGNGRTGRAVVHAFWGKHGLSSATTSVPYSAALAVRKGDYFRALNSFHAMGSLSNEGGAVAPVVDVFAEAIQHALVRSSRLRDDLDAVLARWGQVRLGRAGSLVSRVVDALVSCPAVTVATVCAEHDVSERTARAALRRLTDAKVLTRSRYQQVRVYEAHEMVAAFEAAFPALAAPGDERAAQDAVAGADVLRLVEPSVPPPASTDGAPPVGGVPLCGEWMPKARARCVLRAGHAGHHRATQPWRRTPDNQ